jgi:hypothetical protein
MCVKGIPERIDTGADCKVTMVSWLNRWDEFLVSHGMDSVFWVKDSGDVYRYLITDYALVTLDDVQVNVKGLRGNALARIGITLRSGDTYDLQNLSMSAKALLNSLGPSISASLEKYISRDMAGPELFFQVMLLLESSTTSALRTVEEELIKMRLKSEPGENVETFTSKMMSKIRRLEGANRLPRDLGQIMATSLMDCSVETFRLHFMQVFNELEVDSSKYTYQQIINVATTRYRTALDRHLWTPGSGGQKPDEIPVSMKAELTLLIQSTIDKRVKANQKSASGGNTKGDSLDASSTKTVKCFNCGGQHYARDCPKPKADSSNKKRQGSGAGGRNQVNPANKWKRTPPKKDEAHTKEVSGSTFHWCGTCKQWNTSHGTSDHVAGFKKSGDGGGSTNGSATTGTGQANLAQTGLVAGFLASMSSKDRAGQSN